MVEERTRPPHTKGAARSASASIDSTNAGALALREVYHDRQLGRFIPEKELRALAPFHGFVDVEISGVPPFAMFTNNDDFVAQRYLWHGADAYEPMSLKVWCALARRAPMIWDVGSYTGVFGLAAAMCNRKAKVFAFEPLDRVYFRLLVNSQANRLGNMSLFQLALSDVSAERDLNVFFGRIRPGHGVEPDREEDRA